jgi:tRNA uridine 5-carboxymethylaminomethyl modification enzyme
MFTSRAEYRILLRQDNADARLTKRSHDIGLASDFRYEFTEKKLDDQSRLDVLSDSVNLKPAAVNPYLESIGSTKLSEGKKVSDVLSRPNVEFSKLMNFVPRGTLEKYNSSPEDLQLDYFAALDFDENRFIMTGKMDEKDFSDKVKLSESDVKLLQDNYLRDIYSSEEIRAKYSGYILREEKSAEKIARLEDLKIPDNFDFSKVSGLTIECRQKLFRYHPHTIAQASRISGVSPSDISVLLVYFGR